MCTRQHGGGGGGETSDTDCPLLVRCGLMARATARLERGAFGREGPHTIVVRYVMQSRVCIRKSAWGNVSLIWCAGATAPLKRMASYHGRPYDVHTYPSLGPRGLMSFGCCASIPVQQDAIQKLEDAIEHNLVLAAARVARVRRSNLQAVENHKRAVQMLLKGCSLCTQRRSHGGTSLLRVRGPLRRRTTIGGSDAIQVRLAGGAGRVR